MLKIINDRIKELEIQKEDLEKDIYLFDKTKEAGKQFIRSRIDELEKLKKQYHEKYDLLTPEEKEYLNNIIKPIKEYIKAICIHKYLSRDNLDELMIYYYIGNNIPAQCELCLPIERGSFSKLQDGKEYTLEELDLED